MGQKGNVSAQVFLQFAAMSAAFGGKADILAPADLTNGPYLVPVILSYGNMAPVGYGYAPHGEHLHRC